MVRRTLSITSVINTTLIFFADQVEPVLNSQLFWCCHVRTVEQWTFFVPSAERDRAGNHMQLQHQYNKEQKKRETSMFGISAAIL